MSDDTEDKSPHTDTNTAPQPLKPSNTSYKDLPRSRWRKSDYEAAYDDLEAQADTSTPQPQGSDLEDRIAGIEKMLKEQAEQARREAQELQEQLKAKDQQIAQLKAQAAPKPQEPVVMLSVRVTESARDEAKKLARLMDVPMQQYVDQALRLANDQARKKLAGQENLLP